MNVIERIAGLIPRQQNAPVVAATTAWNCTAWLDIACVANATHLVWRLLAKATRRDRFGAARFGSVNGCLRSQ